MDGEENAEENDGENEEEEDDDDGENGGDCANGDAGEANGDDCAKGGGASGGNSYIVDASAPIVVGWTCAHVGTGMTPSAITKTIGTIIVIRTVERRSSISASHESA